MLLGELDSGHSVCTAQYYSIFFFFYKEKDEMNTNMKERKKKDESSPSIDLNWDLGREKGKS